MTVPDDATEPLSAIQHAIRRAQELRAQGVPFDPKDEIASLRDALGGHGLAVAEVAAAELEVSCRRVALAWEEVKRRRGNIDSLIRSARVRGVRPSLSLPTAEEFLRTWNEPFADALTIEGRAWFARRLEDRLSEDYSTTSGSTPSSPPAAAGRGPTVRPAPPAESRVPERVPLRPLGRWLRSPSGLTFLVLGLLAVVGAYDRLHSLGALSLWNDEAQSTLVAFSIVQHGYPVIHAQHLINNFEPLYPYFEAVSVVLFGRTNFAFRLPAALFGILLIPLSYYVGSRLRDRYVGITLAVMIAFSSEFIAWSRQARWYILLVVLMAIAFLLATVWTRSTDPVRRRWLLVALLVLGALAGLTSVGLFLLYVPAILVGIVVYFVARDWESVRAFFGLPRSPEEPVPPARLVPYWLRQFVAIILPATAILGAVVAPRTIGDIAVPILAKGVGFTPYPLVWSGNFGTYLVQYYLGVLIVAAIGGLFVLQRRRPLELALLAFCLAGFASVSSLASLTNDIAGGTTSFERHLLPFLFFLFLLASLGLVETLRVGLRVLGQARPSFPRFANRRALAFGVIVVILVVLPSVVVPSGVTVHQKTFEYPNSNLVPWVAFTLDPSQPSAVYQSDQADYQLASEYVLAHRNASDVVGATNPGPPAVYLGAVQYWVRGNALNNTVITVDGQPAFFQTGSLLVATTAQLESVMFNHTGWLISDAPNPKGIPFPNGMGDLIGVGMTKIAAASDTTESTYSWGQTSPYGILLDVANNLTGIQGLIGNEQGLVNWAVTTGVTSNHFRGVLLPLEAYFLSQATGNSKALGVLYEVYNHRLDLQTMFPEVITPPASDARLITWGYEVATGQISDSAHAELAPYASVYKTGG